MAMEVFKAVPKEWGNSIGITIPKDVAKKEGLEAGKEATFFVSGKPRGNLKQLFGTVNITKPTQRIMDEIDEGYD